MPLSKAGSNSVSLLSTTVVLDRGEFGCLPARSFPNTERPGALYGITHRPKEAEAELPQDASLSHATGTARIVPSTDYRPAMPFVDSRRSVLSELLPALLKNCARQFFPGSDHCTVQLAMPAIVVSWAMIARDARLSSIGPSAQAVTMNSRLARCPTPRARSSHTQP